MYVGRGGVYSDVWVGSFVIDSRGGVKGVDVYIVVVGEGRVFGAIFLFFMYVSVFVTKNKNREIRRYVKKVKLSRVLL